MKRTRVEEMGANALLEEAFQLLRTAPGSALVAYYLGTLPFILGLLFFWSDMARSAFADRRLFPGSLALGLGFIWMKTWQGVFARHLHVHLCGEPPPRWELGWLLRTAVAQSLPQALGLFLLPLALGLMIPFAWVYAALSNATVFSGDSSATLLGNLKRSWRQALLWPGQNHHVLLASFLFAFFVGFNLQAALLGIPLLLQELLGIETVFSKSPWAAMNSTLTAAVAGLTYLACDPLVKAVYVLRCFYGESLRTAQDLRAELRRCSTAVQVGLVLLVGAVTLGSRPLAAAAAPAAPESDALEPARVEKARPRPPDTIHPPSLDASIERIIQQREYSWRFPRAKVERTADNTWADSLEKLMKDCVEAVGRWLGELWQWLQQLRLNGGLPAPSGSVMGYAMATLLLVLLVAALGLLGWSLFRLWQRREREAQVTPEPTTAAPDLTDENLGAEQLPEDGWIQLARELLGQGEFRLALRALYLATLANLARRQLLTLARFKSNREYEQELQRRAHALAEMPGLFSENVVTFERVWYGRHAATPELVEEFSGRVQRLRQV